MWSGFTAVFCFICVASSEAAVTEELPSSLSKHSIVFEKQKREPEIAAQPVFDSPALRYAQEEEPNYNRVVGLTPMAGVSVLQGFLGANVRSQYTFGLALEFPLVHILSFEAEAMHAVYRLSYQSGGQNIAYSFNQFSAGGNLKLYLSSSRIRPYLGGGIAGVYYDQMSQVNDAGARVSFNRVVGAANMMAGLDFALAEALSIGGRVSYWLPTLNKPTLGQEETKVMNSGVFRVVGSVTVRL
jgi:outer membrane protein W